MFYNKAQREIFNKMLEENRNVRKFSVDESKTFISATGAVGYVFPNSILKINIEMLPTFNTIDIESIVADENKLEETRDFVLADERQKKFARRYKKGKTSVFIDPKLLANFQNPKLYQKETPHGICAVVETIGSMRAGYSTEIVGIVMPIRNQWAGRYSDEL